MATRVGSGYCTVGVSDNRCGTMNGWTELESSPNDGSGSMSGENKSHDGGDGMSDHILDGAGESRRRALKAGAAAGALSVRVVSSVGTMGFAQSVSHHG